MAIQFASKFAVILMIVNTWGVESTDEGCITPECYAGLINEFVTNSKGWQYPKDSRRQFGSQTSAEPEYWGTFDYIIVGAGTSGSVVSSRLSENSRNEVLVLEAGIPENIVTDVPAMAAYLQNSDYNWGYRTTTQKTACLGMQDEKCSYPRGKAVGGSSVINYMMYSRPNKKDFRKWASECPAWTYENVLPYFKKSESASVEKADVDYHGYSGPLSVEDVRYDSPFTNIFIEGNEEIGRKEVDYNGKCQLGVSKLQINTVNGRRCSAGKAFVTPAKQRTNYHLLDKSLVTKILTAGTKAYAVQFLRNGNKYYANATKEIVICAGTINTPQLLMLSGIGPKAELAKHGIVPVKHLNVGRNLHDHSSYMALYFATNTSTDGDGAAAILRALQDYLNGVGVMTTGLGVTGIGFFRYKDDNKCEDIPSTEHVLVGTVIDDAFENYYRRSMLYKDETYDALFSPLKGKVAVGLLPVLEHPKSVGSVTLKSNDPLDFPNIDLNYYSDERGEDLEEMVRAIRDVFEVARTKAFQSVNATYLGKPLPACSHLENFSNEYWRCALRQVTTTLYHPVGTAKMGTGDDAVVDCDFKIRGVDSLRVADVSVVPYSLVGHTNAVAYMVGEKAADAIRHSVTSF